MIEDVRRSRIGEIKLALDKYSSKHGWEIRKYMEPEDFVQNVVVNILSRKGLSSYDSEKCNLDMLVYRIAKNYLIDVKRAKFAKSRMVNGSPVQEVSIHQEIGGTEGLTLEGLLESDVELQSYLLDMERAVPEKRISPNYPLTWRSLFTRSANQDSSDIASDFGISDFRIRQLQKELVKRYLTN